MSWAVVPSIVAGPILMILGFRILDKTKQKLFWSGIAVFGYSFILLLQAIWATHHFYKELNWLVTTNIFINYPRFFLIAGVIITPLVGSILFIVIGLYLMRVNVRRKQLIPTA
jgi:predicted membrane protein